MNALLGGGEGAESPPAHASDRCVGGTEGSGTRRRSHASWRRVLLDPKHDASTTVRIMRPIIGITTYVEPASWGVWHDLPTTLMPHAYTEAVTLAGGRAVLLPPDDLDADVVRMLDGLVLAAARTSAPSLYGAEPEPLTDTRPDRDAGEMLLARAALAADLPILGVCRGMQVLAVAAGGTLHQHLPDVLGHERHRPAPGVYGAHEARFTAGQPDRRADGRRPRRPLLPPPGRRRRRAR